MAGYPHILRKNYDKYAPKQKPETSSETTEQKRQKCQTTAIPEAPVPQTSLSQLEDSKKQQSDLGDPEWQIDWWKVKSHFEREFFDCVGFPYMDAGEVKFSGYFECRKISHNRGKLVSPTNLAKVTTVINIPRVINTLYNYFNNHMHKGELLKELCWSNWLQQVQKDFKSQDIPKIGRKTYVTYDHVCDLKKFQLLFNM